MTFTPFSPHKLHLLCAPSHRSGEYLLERRFAEAISLSHGIRLDFNALLESIRSWCVSEGILRNGQRASFSGMRGGRSYSGTATRFRDELSILIHVEGEGRKRFRIPSLWCDYSWLVLYQEPLLGEWRSWPGAAKDWTGMEKDRTEERKAREGFEWVCRRKIISRARLFRGEELITEYFAPSFGKK
jgi:hypothetical protein